MYLNLVDYKYIWHLHFSIRDNWQVIFILPVGTIPSIPNLYSFRYILLLKKNKKNLFKISVQDKLYNILLVLSFPDMAIPIMQKIFAFDFIWQMVKGGWFEFFIFLIYFFFFYCNF